MPLAGTFEEFHDLYRAYKHTPHQPAAVFLKYPAVKYSRVNLSFQSGSARFLDSNGSAFKKPDCLGAINHTLLTIREIERSKMRVAGIIMNAASNADAPMVASNKAENS